MTSLRIYLAGPEVFLRLPAALAGKKKTLCRRFGFEGIFPSDAVLDLKELSPQESGISISRANELLIRTCQLVIANITPFRGPSCDAGTAYEMGFARGLGLPVFAYTNVTTDFTSRTTQFVKRVHRRKGGLTEDSNQMAIEPFALADNLMLIGGIQHSGGKLEKSDAPNGELYTDLTAFESCLAAANQALSPRASKGR